jgi:antitoxin component YwqK of YwqJK toxin-antitoxin module
VLHGISREFYNQGNLHTEDEYYDGKRLTRRIYHPNGSVDRYTVRGVIVDQRDERNNPIKEGKSTQ